MIEGAVFIYCTIDDQPIETSPFYRMAQAYSQAFADSITYDLIIPFEKVSDDVRFSCGFNTHDLEERSDAI